MVTQYKILTLQPPPPPSHLSTCAQYNEVKLVGPANSHKHAEDDHNVPEGDEDAEVSQVAQELPDLVSHCHLATTVIVKTFWVSLPSVEMKVVPLTPSSVHLTFNSG